VRKIETDIILTLITYFASTPLPNTLSKRFFWLVAKLLLRLGDICNVVRHLAKANQIFWGEFGYGLPCEAGLRLT
jgi:hypothetical protein